MRCFWLVFVGAALTMPTWAAAEEDEGYVALAGDLRIVHAWARASQGPDGAVYMEIHNEGQTDDRLLGGRAEVAEAVRGAWRHNA